MKKIHWILIIVLFILVLIIYIISLKTNNKSCRPGFKLENNGDLCKSDLKYFECTDSITQTKGRYICDYLIIEDKHTSLNISIEGFENTGKVFYFKGRSYDTYIPCFSKISRVSQAICDEVYHNAIIEFVEDVKV